MKRCCRSLLRERQDATAETPSPKALRASLRFQKVLRARRWGWEPTGMRVMRESVRVRMIARSAEASSATRSMAGLASGSEGAKRMAEGEAPTSTGLATRRLRISTGVTRPAARSATYMRPASLERMAEAGAEPRSMVSATS